MSTQGQEIVKVIVAPTVVGPALNLLPPELKSLIVEFIALIDEEGNFNDDDDFSDEDEDDDTKEEHDCSKHAPGEHGHSHGGGEGGHEHEHAEDGNCCKPVMPAMIALSLVNREFAELAYPYIYKESLFFPSLSLPSIQSLREMQKVIDFANCTNFELAMFITNVLPRQGKHIEMLSCDLDEFEPLLNSSSDSDEEEEDDDKDDIDEVGKKNKEEEEALELVKVEAFIERVVQTSKNPSDFGREFSIRQRHNLISFIINKSPNLNTIAFTIEPMPMTNSGEGALFTLKSIGDRIIDLTLDGTGGAFDANYLSRFLKAFPNLLRLDLDFPSMTRSGELDLINTLTGFKKLKNLYLSSFDFVGEDFVNANWECPLELLALSDIYGIKFSHFITLINHFSTTLKTLDIDDIPDNSSAEENELYLGKPFNLPVLENLILATQHSGLFLNSFLSSPLIKELTICHCPSITISQWESFITSLHASGSGHLKTVNLENDSILSEAQIESLELWLLTKKIELNIEPEDSDDDDHDSLEDEDDDDGERYEDDYDGVGTDDAFDEMEEEDEDSEGDGFSGEEER